jgi:hypothetical protein
MTFLMQLLRGPAERVLKNKFTTFAAVIEREPVGFGVITSILIEPFILRLRHEAKYVDSAYFGRIAIFSQWSSRGEIVIKSRKHQLIRSVCSFSIYIRVIKTRVVITYSETNGLRFRFIITDDDIIRFSHTKTKLRIGERRAVICHKAKQNIIGHGWHFISFSLNRRKDRAKVYIDGIDHPTEKRNHGDCTFRYKGRKDRLNIGRHIHDNGHRYGIVMASNFKIFRVPLHQRQVDSLYKQSKSL